MCKERYLDFVGGGMEVGVPSVVEVGSKLRGEDCVCIREV